MIHVAVDDPTIADTIGQGTDRVADPERVRRAR